MRFRYRLEEEMKDSGVEWIGKIPKEWECVNFSRLVTLKQGLQIAQSDRFYEPGKNRFIYITVKYINSNKNDNDTEYILNPDEGVVCKNDDVLLARTGATGKVVTNIEGVFHNNFFKVIYNKSQIVKEYLVYYLTQRSIQEHLKLVAGTTTIPDLNHGEFLATKFISPCKNEQQKITNFLDEKTSQFDTIISKKEALIQTLEEAKKSLISEVVTGKIKVLKTSDGYELVEREKEEMKDSGVEWIGEIPKNYKTIRLGLISFVTKLAGFEYTNHMANALSSLGEVPIVRAGNIKMNKFIDQENEFIDIETSKMLNRSALYQKCILITFIGAGIGEVALFNKAKRHHLAPNVAKIEILGKNKQKIDEQFLIYYLMSSAGQEEVNKIKKASAQPSLSMETIRSMKIVLPECYEQDNINKYLGLKIEEIDQITSKTLQQIRKIKEAKQALISEAVTGKIEILD